MVQIRHSRLHTINQTGWIWVRWRGRVFAGFLDLINRPSSICKWPWPSWLALLMSIVQRAGLRLSVFRDHHQRTSPRVGRPSLVCLSFVLTRTEERIGPCEHRKFRARYHHWTLRPKRFRPLPQRIANRQ